MCTHNDKYVREFHQFLYSNMEIVPEDQTWKMSISFMHSACLNYLLKVLNNFEVFIKWKLMKKMPVLNLLFLFK